jgi:hypothetical protein
MFKRIALVFTLTLFALVGAGAYVFSKPFPPLPSLFVGLACNPTPNCGEAVNLRLQQRFPFGSAETGLIQELRSEGFQPVADLSAPQRKFVFDRLGDVIHDVCRRSGEVNWSADNAGHLTVVSGSYVTSCP